MADQPEPRRTGTGPAAAYEFRLFGRFAGRRLADGSDVTPRGRKARALLAYLLVEPRRVERDRLAGLLWSERGQPQAHASLRQCLLEFRDLSHGPEPLLKVERHQIGATGASDLDIERMAALAIAGDADGLAAAFGEADTLLEDLDGLDPAWDQWLRAVRTSRGDALLAGARDACVQAIASGRAESALKLARQLQRIDPLDEAAARLAMEASSAAGQPRAGQRVYEALGKALRDELGAEPDAATRALHDKLARDGRARTPAAAAAPAPALSPDSVPMEEPPTRSLRRRWLRASFLTLSLVAAAALLWLGGGGQDIPSVSVVAQPGVQAEMLARDLSNDLVRLAGARPDALSVVDTGDSTRADYEVRVGSERAGDLLRVSLGLLSRGSPELLWSARFERPAGEISDLREQMSASLGSVLMCAGESRSAARLDTSTERLFLAACEQAEDPPSQERLGLLRQITLRNPDFAPALAMQALVEADLAAVASYTLDGRPNPLSRQLSDAARIHLQRARELDPTLGDSYAAEAALITELPRWAERLEAVERGIRVDPDNAHLHESRSVLLSEVGRMTDAVESARRAAELNPVSANSRAIVILSLAHAGRLAPARRELERAERIWPGSTTMRHTRYAFDLRYGDPAHALRMIEAADVSGVSRGVPARIEWERAFLRARIDPTEARVNEALRPVRLGLSTRNRVASFYVQALGALGLNDQAYDYVERREALSMEPGTVSTLFRPFMRGFRHDRRFMPLMARIGLVQYWQESGVWPDFCIEPELPYDCRAEARRLLASAQKGGAAR